MSGLRLLSYMSPGFPRSLFEAVGGLVDASVAFDETRSGPQPDSDPFASGLADLGWICSTSYVALADPESSPTVQLAGVAWVPVDPGSSGRPVYFGDVVARPGSAIGSLDDLQGRRVGCNDPVSLSGNYSLRFALDDLGHDAETFCQFVYTGGHHQSLDMLLAGDLDVAVVDSIVRTGRARYQPELDELVLVERLGPFPVQPLVARVGLDPDIVASVKKTLMEAGPQLAPELHAASLSALVEVEPNHYEPVRAAMQRLAARRRH